MLLLKQQELEAGEKDKVKDKHGQSNKMLLEIGYGIKFRLWNSIELLSDIYELIIII